MFANNISATGVFIVMTVSQHFNRSTTKQIIFLSQEDGARINGQLAGRQTSLPDGRRLRLGPRHLLSPRGRHV